MSLEVLIVEGEEPVTDVLAEALAQRGHVVSRAASAEQALSLSGRDVIVCEAGPPGACGFDLLSAAQARGDDARFVILLGDPTVDECLRALRLGATDLLRKPFRIEELLRAVERAAGTARAPFREVPDSTFGRTFERSYPALPESVDRAAREIVAFALVHGIPPSVRARIGGAVQEILDNAVQHAGGGFRAQARLEAGTLTVRVEDSGRGFDPEPDGRSGPARTGLDRARALSERLSIRSTPGRGTCVDLAFATRGTAFPTSCSGGGEDLSEADYLSRGQATGVLDCLLDGRTPDVEALSPAIAVALGRLLAGPERSLASRSSPPHPRK